MSRRQLVWGTGTTVLLAAASGALINELHQGWPWWLAAVVVTGAGVVLAARLAAGPPDKAGTPAPGTDTAVDTDMAEKTDAAESSGGGHANTGVITGDSGRPARAYKTGPATAHGHGSIANTGVIRQPGDPR
jgi:hypothetical protein